MSKPISKISMFPVTAAIWRNEGTNGRAYYSVSFERRYKDDQGQWQNTASFDGNDLLLLAKVADMAHTEIAKLRAADRDADEAAAA